MMIIHLKSSIFLRKLKWEQMILYEIRLIFEPEIAYYATLRATDKELERINAIKNEIEDCITNKKVMQNKKCYFTVLLHKQRIMNLCQD